MKSWYTLSEEEVLKELQTDRETGLSEAESAARLEKYGANELEGHKQESMLVRVLGQLKDPMIIVLLIAAVLSFISSGFEDWVEPLIILLIVVVNTVIIPSSQALSKTKGWVNYEDLKVGECSIGYIDKQNSFL